MNCTTIHWLIPEIILGAASALICVAGTFNTSRRLLNSLAVVGLLLAGGALYMINRDVAIDAIGGPVIPDTLGVVFRGLSIVVGLLLVVLQMHSTDQPAQAEVLAALLLVICGLMLVATSGDLVLMFLGLELISIPTYLLLFLGRVDRNSLEATLKYFFLSILSSAMLLYGFSFLYGISGSTRFGIIAERISAAPADAPMFDFLAPLALLLIASALGFKIAAVPFHFYAPDVYQGTTDFNASLLAVVPKIAGIVGLVRLVATMIPALATVGWQICLVLALLTMTIGNIVALWQQNVRRMMAYSSIANAGYLLIGLAVWLVAAGQGADDLSANGLAATFLYLTVYAAATIGAFSVLILLGQSGSDIHEIDDLSGLGSSHRTAALAMAIFMFSLTGIPLLAGFWGKLLLLSGALAVQNSDVALGGWTVRWWFICLAIVGVVNVAISAAYYLKVVATMYFRAPVDVPRAATRRGGGLVIGCCVVLTLGIGVYPGPFIGAARNAARSISDAVSNRSPSAGGVTKGTSEGGKRHAALEVPRPLNSDSVNR